MEKVIVLVTAPHRLECQRGLMDSSTNLLSRDTDLTPAPLDSSQQRLRL
jgi:hypothetical protein